MRELGENVPSEGTIRYSKNAAMKIESTCSFRNIMTVNRNILFNAFFVNMLNI